MKNDRQDFEKSEFKIVGFNQNFEKLTLFKTGHDIEFRQNVDYRSQSHSILEAAWIVTFENLRTSVFTVEQMIF